MKRMNRNKFIVNFCLGFVKVTGIIPALIFLKPRVTLAQNAKRKLEKPCILVSNHISLMDFVLYLIVFPLRTIHFLTAEVLYNRNKFLAKFLYSIGCIQVNRDSMDFDFVADTIEVLDKGGTVGIFPQGRLPLNGKKFPFAVSTAFIATHCDAPIVPVYTNGNYGLFKRADVVIGEAIYLSQFKKEGLSDDEQLTHLTNVLEEKVYELKNLIKKDDADE